jgi:4,5-DOPA dioxygenase extradiol
LASFYGFPRQYYKAQYPNVGDPVLADRVMGMLAEAGIQSQGKERGLDHGVWSGFNVGSFMLPSCR